MSGWLETHRGTVFRWEVDHNDHLTVAYYFARLAEAALALLDALGLGTAYAARRRRACVTEDCFVRYVRELRAGDLLHVTSAIIAIEPDGLLLGHKLFDSGAGALCTTIEQRVRHVTLPERAPTPLAPAHRDAAQAHRAAWDGPPREHRPRPRNLDGFRETARDTVKPRELDGAGQLELQALIHRFSAANGHAIAAFGLTPDYQRRTRRGFSTFEFQLAITGAPRAGDLVSVRSGLLHIGSSSMRLLHALADARTGAPLATLEQLGVHLDMDARRPTPLPEALRDRARALVVPVPA